MAISHYASIPAGARIDHERRINGKLRENIRNEIKGIISDLDVIPVHRGDSYADLINSVNTLTTSMQNATRNHLVINENIIGEENHHLDGGYWYDINSNLFNGSMDPNVVTIESVQRQIDEIMLDTHGDAMKNENFKRVVNRMEKLMEAKAAYDFEHTLHATEWELFYFDQLEKKLDVFEAEVNKFVKKTRTGKIAIDDYKNIDGLAKLAQYRVRDFKEDIVDKEAEIAEDIKKDPAILKLIEANNIAIANMANVDNEKELLDSIEDNNRKIEVLKDAKRGEITKLENDLNQAVLLSDSMNKLKTDKHTLYTQEEALLKDMEIANQHVDQFNEKIDNAVSDSILKDMVRIYRTLNDSRRRDTNSSFYNNMIAPLCLAINKQIPTIDMNLKDEDVNLEELNRSPEALAGIMKMTRDAAKRYIQAKGDLSWYSTKQAHQRINLAKQLIAFSDSVNKRIAFAQRYKDVAVKPRLEEFKAKTELVKNFKGRNPEDFGRDFENSERYRKFGDVLNKVAKMQADKEKNLQKKEVKVVVNPQNNNNKQAII